MTSVIELKFVKLAAIRQMHRPNLALKSDSTSGDFISSDLYECTY